VSMDMTSRLASARLPDVASTLTLVFGFLLLRVASVRLPPSDFF